MSVNVKKIVGLLALALLIFFVITQPTVAANSVQTIAAWLRNAAMSISTFFQGLLT